MGSTLLASDVSLLNSLQFSLYIGFYEWQFLFTHVCNKFVLLWVTASSAWTLELWVLAFGPREWGMVVLLLLKRHWRDPTVVILPLRSRVLQWSCHLSNWKHKKTKRTEKYIIVIDDLKLKLYIIFIITRKLHDFGPRYNLKQKYIALISSYNLEKENYKDKPSLLTIDLSSEAILQDWKSVRHLTCQVKLIF